MYRTVGGAERAGDQVGDLDANAMACEQVGHPRRSRSRIPRSCPASPSACASPSILTTSRLRSPQDRADGSLPPAAGQLAFGKADRELPLALAGRDRRVRTNIERCRRRADPDRSRRTTTTSTERPQPADPAGAGDRGAIRETRLVCVASMYRNAVRANVIVNAQFNIAGHPLICLPVNCGPLHPAAAASHSALTPHRPRYLTSIAMTQVSMPLSQWSYQRAISPRSARVAGRE